MAMQESVKQHISVNDIAEANGVSLSTVYRVMRGAGKTRSPKHLRVRTKGRLNLGLYSIRVKT